MRQPNVKIRVAFREFELPTLHIDKPVTGVVAVEYKN